MNIQCMCLCFQILCTSTEDGHALDSLIAKNQNQGHEDMEALDLQDELFADVVTEEMLEKKRPATKARQCLETRQKWTLEEEAEIKTLFKKYFECEITPTAKSIKKAHEASKKTTAK